MSIRRHFPDRLPLMRIMAGWVLGLAFLCPGLSGGALVDAFSGYVDLAAVQARINDLRRESLRQDYTLAFDHRLAPYLDFRVGLRYYKFDQDIDAILGSYQEEWQPSADLRWNHPLFTFSSTIRQKKVKGSGTDGWIVTDDLQFHLQTKDRRYPLLSAGYDQQEINSVDAGQDKHIRNDRLRASASYQAGKHMFKYNFSHLVAENVVTALDSRSIYHTLRWEGSGSPRPDRRLDLSGNYVFTYGQVENEVHSGDTVLQVIPPFRGLYLVDDAPDFGALGPFNGLIDGNTQIPTVPPIDIGGTNSFRNLGLDLGSRRDIAGLYIYTDRPSDPNLGWQVFVSDDNRTWELWDASPLKSFNAALNRYELLFRPGLFRYVKAVNVGLNNIALVHPTEIKALEELLPTANQTRHTASHNFGGRAAYRLSHHWNTALETNIRHEKTQSVADTRQDINYAWRLRYTPSDVYTHQLRWEQSFQTLEGRDNPRNDVAAYSLVIEPMEVMRGSISASNRRSYISGEHERNNFNVAFQGNGTPYYGLDVEVGAGWSRILDFRFDDDYKTWLARLAFDAQMTSFLTIIQDNSYQETRTDLGDFRVQTINSLGLDWRVSGNIYFRSSLRYIRQIQKTLTGDILLGWTPSRKFRMSAQYYGVRYNEVTTTERWSINGSLDLSRRSNLYARLSEVDLSGGGGNLTKSWQIGFRWSF